MSEILIRGIEKPKSCRACPFRQETYLLTRQICIVNHNEELCTGIDKIDESCPISQVQPHGDLIDRDALIMEHRADNYDFAIYASYLVQNAPTIIPASE